MKQLTLLRHAKSSWNSSAESDHDRPLNKRGRGDAPVMGKRMRKAGVIPELVLCSSALRTQQTAQLLLPALFKEDFEWCQSRLKLEPALYLASPGKILSCLEAQQAEHIMVIAHNPGLEMLAGMLSHDPLLMPTCSVYSFTLDPMDNWLLGDETESELVFSDYPKNLPNG